MFLFFLLEMFQNRKLRTIYHFENTIAFDLRVFSSDVSEVSSGHIGLFFLGGGGPFFWKHFAAILNAEQVHLKI